MKKYLLFVAVIIAWQTKAQLVPDSNYYPFIKTVKLFPQNNQEALPVLRLNTPDLLEFHFDDVENNFVKNYSYSLILCNADWSETPLSPFDYLKGFTNMRIVQARPSSITLNQYVHYQTTFPEKNCVPTKSGNYLLKVFMNGDEDNVVLTKRFYVVDNKINVGIRTLQPFDFNKAETHQKLMITVNTAAIPNIYNPAQNVKMLIMQNQRWDNAITNIQPTFIRENSLEYDSENDCVFEAGNEYRWIDLRSFRFMSDRIANRTENGDKVDVYATIDATRNGERYVTYKDLNGASIITTTELVNNWWQTGYANVHFTYKPQKGLPYVGNDMYIVGDFTGNKIADENKMKFNMDLGVYEKTLYLKQGFYSYNYVTKDKTNKNAKATTLLTEGNDWQTENNYTVFIYYRSFIGRYDELVGYTTVNTRFGKID
jgi:hypothetical protein